MLISDSNHEGIPPKKNMEEPGDEFHMPFFDQLQGLDRNSTNVTCWEKNKTFFFFRSAYRGCFFLRGFKVQFVVEVEGGVWLQDVLFCFK